MNKILSPNDVNLTDNQFSLLSQAFGAQINIGRNLSGLNGSYMDIVDQLGWHKLTKLDFKNKRELPYKMVKVDSYCRKFVWWLYNGDFETELNIGPQQIQSLFDEDREFTLKIPGNSQLLGYGTFFESYDNVTEQSIIRFSRVLRKFSFAAQQRLGYSAARKPSTVILVSGLNKSHVIIWLDNERVMNSDLLLSIDLLNSDGNSKEGSVNNANNN